MGSNRNSSNDTSAALTRGKLHHSTRSRGRLVGITFAAALAGASGCGDGDYDNSTGGTHSGGNASGGNAVGGASGGTAGKASGGDAGALNGGSAGSTTGGQSSGGASDGGVGGAASGAQNGGGDPGGAGAAGAGGEPATGGSSSGGDAGSTAGGTTGTAGETNGGAAGAGTAGAAGSVNSVPRPQLTSAQAAEDTILKHLEKAGSLLTGLVADNWDPTAGLGDLSGISPTYRVATTGSGTHTTVQDAINDAVASPGVDRVYIRVEPGTYRGMVCVPVGAPPITLYGANADASQTVIVFDNYNAKPKAVGTPANPCSPNLAGANYGVSGSATFAAYGNGFQAKNLSFVNDTDEAATGMTKGLQAVALIAQGDQLLFENVRVLGNQYSLYVKSPNTSTVSRAYFKSSYVEGDLDFIIGRATFVLDGCEIHYLTSRQGWNDSFIVAPSTDSRNPYGILIANATFTAEAGTPLGNIYLGHAWDESTTLDEYKIAFDTGGVYPNGQALIRNSVLGEHIRPADPWAMSTNKRPFSTVTGEFPANRLYEFENTGPGSAAP